MMTSCALSAETSCASLSAPTGLPIEGPSPPAFEAEKNAGSINAKSFSCSMRCSSTDPTMPREPTKPTRIMCCPLVTIGDDSRSTATPSFIGLRLPYRPERRVQSRHGAGIHVPPVAKCIGAAGSLDCKPELSIQVQSCQVVRVHPEFEPLVVEPGVGKLDRGPQQRRADA